MFVTKGIQSNFTQGEEKIDRPSVNKFDDELRRQQLLEIKKKFQSKRFWNDSKYDKIEGLNWISWK